MMEITPKRKAFLDLIAFSEIGSKLLSASDQGYNVIVGGTQFKGYKDHPRQKVFLKKLGIYSTAAGRYQILARYYDAYKSSLNLPDFSPASQDQIALQMINERHAIKDVDLGNIESAIQKVRNIWASLPGAGYGQHENKLEVLIAYYNQNLKTIVG